MNGSCCAWLDDYLEESLPGESVEVLVRHLNDCPECRRAVEEQQHMEVLLRRAVMQDSPTPPRLVEAASEWKCLSSESVQRRRWRSGLLAWLQPCCWGWERLSGGIGQLCRLKGRMKTAVADVSPTLVAENIPPRSRVYVTATSPKGVDVVQLPSSTPNVSIFWLFPNRQVASETESSEPKSFENSNRGGL